MQVLRTALEKGYFKRPKRVRLEELASKIGVSKATVAEHLRKALGKVLNAYIHGGSWLDRVAFPALLSHQIRESGELLIAGSVRSSVIVRTMWPAVSAASFSS